MPQSQKFTGIGTGVIIGAAFATIVGVSAHGGDAGTIHACVDHAGNLKVVGPSEACKQNETALDWNLQGAKGDKGDPGDPGQPGQPGAKGDTGAMGPPGTFTGEFTSPNQAYRLSVTDTGIEMAGPTALIRIGNSGIDIASALAVRIEGTTTVEIKSAAIVDIESGGIITLKGTVVNVP